MERRLKERLIGAAVLVLLAVIFVPMLLDDSAQYNTEIKESNIPEKPVNEFSSRVIPIEETAPVSEQMTSDNVTEITDEPVLAEAGTVAEQTTDNTHGTEADAVEETPVASAPRDKHVGVRAWIVQLGSFSSETNAQKLNEDLRKRGFTAFVEPLQQKSKTIYRVRVGPELLRSDAEDICDKIEKSMQMEGIVIPYP